MQKSNTGPLIAVIIVIGLIIVGAILLMTGTFSYLASPAATTTTPVVVVATSSPIVATSSATSTEPVDETKTELGMSADGKPITAYHYGDGEDEVLFIGGIHGGYSWNTTLVAYELMDYLEANESVIPDNVKVTVIPVMNPDGLEAVVGTTGRFEASAVPSNQEETIVGRFNGNNVDLNRNFDCEWQRSGTWQNREVSGGSEAFSEPEAKAIRDYVSSHDIAGAVVWYSAAGGVYASNCRNGVSDETRELTALYGKAAQYPAKAEFNFYEITGDMVNWLAKENVPAISVLLTTHSDPEWEKNQAGVEALLEYYAD